MAARSRRQPRVQDSFGKRAKQEGYPARSVYKLEEIDRRMRLLRRGQRVLDLGAAPGSWSLYASSRVGREGRVLGLDLNEAASTLPPNAEFRAVDVLSVETSELGGDGAFDVVLSDMAPSTSGQRHADQFLSYQLYMRALTIAGEVLTPKGKFVGKIFQGAEFEDARRETRERFSKVRIIKPEASRDESYEVFIVATDPKP